MDILANYWIWWILAAVLMMLEIFAPGAFMIWIGLAAGLTGIFALLLPGAGIGFELLFFAVFSVALAVMGRRYVQGRQKATDHPNLNVRGAQYVGRSVVVIQEIKNGKGKVKVGDTEWIATGSDAKVGETVKIIGVEGTALQVKQED